MLEPTLKTFKNVDEQIEILLARGMIIDDLPRAKRYLNLVGYFRLSAYWHNMRVIELDDDGKEKLNDNGEIERSDDFVANVNFNTVIDLYAFDRDLRVLLTEAFQRIEIAVRSSIVKTIAPIDSLVHQKLVLGVFKSNFVNPKKDRARSTRDVWLSKHDELLDQSRQERFIKHYVSKHGNTVDLPIWIAAETWTFGATQHLLAGLAPKYADQIASDFGIGNHSVLVSWMVTFNYARNLCAHHRRVWNRRITDQPKLLPPQDSEMFKHLWEFDDKTERYINPNNNKLYGLLFITQFLMSIISPDSDWKPRLIKLMKTWPGFEEFNREVMGFPEDWESQKLWAGS